MNPASTWKYINKGLLIILGAFVVATIASILFLSYSLLKLDSLIIKSSQSVRSALLLQNVFISLNDAESGVRGFVITGDPESVKSYRVAQKEVPETLRLLKKVDTPEIPDAQIDRLSSLANERLAVLGRLIEARGSQAGQVSVGGEGFSAIITATREGSVLMDSIRQEVNKLSTASLDAITTRQDRSHGSLQRALGVAAAVSVLIIGLCGVLIWYFQRTIMQERALEGTKNEFLSLASHQLRTPATNVKQYVGLLLDGYLGSLTKKQKNALQIAYKNNESEIRIMNDLLDVAKLDLKRIQLRKQRVNVVSLVRQAVNDYTPIAESRGQSLKFTAPKEVSANVDRTYFKSVIEKLIDNALKYSRDNTFISVKVRADEARGVFEVIVKDNGLGIQKREISKLFMKFSRLTNEFSANSEGSGLGLYWVKQIMTLHEGTVLVTTQEGRGSKFTVRAPF
jgi:signal transduction histidine kinase